MPHELPHTAASLAVSAGANVKAVQRLLGHASAAMTLDRYAHLFDSDLDAVADRLDEVASRARQNRGPPTNSRVDSRAGRPGLHRRISQRVDCLGVGADPGPALVTVVRDGGGWPAGQYARLLLGAVGRLRTRPPHLPAIQRAGTGEKRSGGWNL